MATPPRAGLHLMLLVDSRLRGDDGGEEFVVYPHPESTTVHTDSVLQAAALFVVDYNLYLLGRWGRGVELVAQPLLDDTVGKFGGDHTLAQAEDLAVVGEYGPLDGVRVVCDDGAYPAHLVGRDGLAQARSAEEHRPVRLTSRDRLGGPYANYRVRGLVVSVCHAEVDDLIDPRIFPQLVPYKVLEVDPGIVGADRHHVPFIVHFCAPPSTSVSRSSLISSNYGKDSRSNTVVTASYPARTAGKMARLVEAPGFGEHPKLKHLLPTRWSKS